jgi:hypothetical protein
MTDAQFIANMKGFGACLASAHKQPYQNWVANFLAQDLVAYGLSKFWQE